MKSEKGRAENLAVLKNKTQGLYVNVSKEILTDKSLSLRDRGMMVTVLSLSDNWDFNVRGFAKILPDVIEVHQTPQSPYTENQRQVINNKVNNHPFINQSRGWSEGVNTIGEISAMDVLQWQNEMLSKRDENGFHLILQANTLHFRFHQPTYLTLLFCHLILCLLQYKQLFNNCIILAYIVVNGIHKHNSVL